MNSDDLKRVLEGNTRVKKVRNKPLKLSDHELQLKQHKTILTDLKRRLTDAETTITCLRQDSTATELAIQRHHQLHDELWKAIRFWRALVFILIVASIIVAFVFLNITKVLISHRSNDHGPGTTQTSNYGKDTGISKNATEAK